MSDAVDRDDVAGVEPDPELQSLRRRTPVVPDPEPVEHPSGRPHRAYGIVLVSARYAEHGHDVYSETKN